ncbi:HAD-like domain-containing protein [Zychaea mexicana]|uniref:HAD-like domain-containing protein n=1 Tax=Zychaea mexicana TaxID=64656 RepID=UPI0022FECCF2|nr:HAD-like domain-containing protein [Zychaea mexicana]KAI9489511.1 HAD-like domain-containing protein [Zychaea mexicana]
MQYIQGLQAVISKNEYYTIASDVYGVLHDGAKPYPYTRECIEKLHNLGLETILLSNSSRLGNVLANDLQRKYGFDKTKYKRVLSSGDVTRRFLHDCIDLVRQRTKSTTTVTTTTTNIADHEKDTTDCSATMLVGNKNNTESRTITAHEFVQNHIKTGRFHLIGNADYHAPLYEALAPEMNPVSLDDMEVDFVLVGLIMSLPHQQLVNPNDRDNIRQHYDAYLRQCREKDIPLVIANPDVRAPNGSNSDGTPRLLMCPGYIGELYQEMGGKVLYFGKPFATIYRYLSSIVQQQEQQQGAGDDGRRRRVLCVGDNISTDVLGARRAGLDVALVLGGVHNISTATTASKATTVNNNDTSDYTVIARQVVEQLCFEYDSPEPTYIMDELRF